MYPWNSTDLLHVVVTQIAALGGRCGTWDSRDHDVFIKIWTQLGCSSHLRPDGDELMGRNDIDSIEGDESSKNVQLILPIEQHTALMRRLRPLMPGKDSDDVVQHINWYVILCSLQAQKKALLASWREEKRKQATAATCANAANEVGLEETEADDSGNPGSFQRGGLDGGAGVSQEEREAIKERIARWKQERQEQEQRQQVRMSHICHI